MSREDRPTVELECEWKCTKETRKAVLVENDDGDEVWIPKSVLGADNEVNAEGESGRVHVQEWFAEQECLEVAE